MTITPVITTLELYTQQLASWERKLLLDTGYNKKPLWEAIMEANTSWIAASDGSHNDFRASYAWTLSNGTTIVQHGQGLVQGNPITAFREELYGLLAIYCTLYHITHYYDIYKQLTIQPHVDATTVIKYHQYIINSTYPNTPYMDHIDIYPIMHRYHHELKARGIEVLEALKVPSQRGTGTIKADQPTSLHQHADDIARKY